MIQLVGRHAFAVELIGISSRAGTAPANIHAQKVWRNIFL